MWVLHQMIRYQHSKKSVSKMRPIDGNVLMSQIFCRINQNAFYKAVQISFFCVFAVKPKAIKSKKKEKKKNLPTSDFQTENESEF